MDDAVEWAMSNRMAANAIRRAGQEKALLEYDSRRYAAVVCEMYNEALSGAQIL